MVGVLLVVIDWWFTGSVGNIEWIFIVLLDPIKSKGLISQQPLSLSLLLLASQPNMPHILSRTV